MRKKKARFSQNDFTNTNLPLTRKRQFFDILKNEWRTILLLSLIGLAFALPYIVCLILEMSLSDGTSMMMAEQGKTVDEIAIQLTQIQFSQLQKIKRKK